MSSLRRVTGGLILSLFGLTNLLGPVLPVSQAQNTCIFNDVCDTTDSAYSAIKTLKDQGIIQGNPDGSFDPGRIVNRAEMLTMLFRATPQDVHYDKAYGFPDVSASAWYAASVSTAKRLKFVQGYPDGTFRGGDAVKTEEAAKMAIAFQKTPLPAIQKGYTGESQENSLPYGIALDQWYTPYLKTVHDFELLDTIGLAQGLTRADAAILLARTQKAVATIKAPLSLLTTWSPDGSTILENGGYSAFLYFSKPVDLTSAKAAISVTGNNGRKITTWSLAAYSWGFDKEKLNLTNYAFRPQELKINMWGLQDRETVTIIMQQGVKDIYGTALDKPIKLTYKTTANPLSISLGGPSYMKLGDKQEASLLLESKGEVDLQGVTGYLCPVSAETVIQKSQETTVASDDRSASVEYLPLATQLAPQDALKPYCSNIKTADLTGLSKDSQEATFNIEDAFKTKLTPGIYFLGVYSQGTASVMGKTNAFAHHLVYVADTALTLKYTQTTPMKGFVWATDMTGNDGRANLPIKIYAVNSDSDVNTWKQVASGSTNNDGIFRFEMPDQLPWTDHLIAVTDSKDHFGLVGSQWNMGLEPYNYGLSMAWDGQNGQLKDNRIFIYTDRKIYRPGHDVGIRGVVRQKTDDGYIVPKPQALTAAIYDSQFKLVSSFPVTTSDQGTFSGSVHLPAMASIGEYSIVMTDATPTQDFQYDQPIQANFQVEEYVRPDFRVTLDEGKKDYINGERLNIGGKAEYYFGLPVSGGTYHWELTRESLYFQPENTTEWFSFSDGAFCYYYCDSSNGTVASDDGTLGTDGSLHINTPLDLGDSTTGGLYTLTVEAYDQNNRVVRAEQTFRVHKATSYVGLSTRKYMVKEGDGMSFNAITLTYDGKTLPNTKIDLELVREDWTNYAKQDVSGDMMSYNDKQENVVATKTITTGADGRAVVDFPAQKPGQYFLRGKVTDSKGNTNTAREYTYVYPTSEGTYIQWASDDLYKVQLLLDKPEYKPGETAQMVIQSPYSEATALITMERGSVLDTMKVDLTSNGAPIQIPVKASYVPNVYISAVIMPKNGQQGLKMGYGTLMVDTSQKELTIGLQTDKKTYGPGDTVSVDVTTTNKSGQPVAAEVSLAVVDESVIALAGGVDRDIMRAFYSMESLSVWTANSLTHYVQRGLIRAVGGSGKGGPSGLPILRGLLKDTAYWNPSIRTDASGKAHVQFILPDNLTRWEMLSIGATKDTQVGSSSIEIDTRQDLVLQPVLPRFVRNGDKVTLTYTVFNLSDQADNVRLSLTSPDVTLPKNIFTAKVPAKGSATATWDVTVPQNIDAISLLAEAQGDRLSDRYTSRLPVYAPDTYDISSVSGFSSAKDLTVTPAIPANASILRDKSFLTLRVSAGLLGSLTPSLAYLVQYPYGCAEQTTSVLMGNLLLGGFMKASSIALPGVDTKAIDANVTAALTRLYQYQSDSGGFALWGGNDGVDPYLSSYVLEGMKMASDNGYAVDTASMKKLRDYLQNTLAKGAIADKDTRAGAIAILRETGATGLDGTADTLFKDRTSLSMMGRTALVRYYSADTSSLGKDRMTTLLGELRKNLKVDGNMTQVVTQPRNGYFYFDIPTMNGAALEALAIGAPDDQNIPGLVNFLLSNRNEGAWATTHDNALILRGLNRVLAHNKAATGVVTITASAGTTTQTLSFPQGALSPEQEIRIPLSSLTGTSFPIKLSTSAPGMLYYDASVSYVQTEQKQQITTTDYQIYRELLENKDGYLVPLTHPIHLGDKISIRLSVRSKNGTSTGKHVAIEDMIPAGLELQNPTIVTQGGKITADEGWYQFYELHDDRSMFYLGDAHDMSVTLEARAIAPGTFAYPAAKAFEMYRPEKYTRSTPATLVIQR